MASWVLDHPRRRVTPYLIILDIAQLIIIIGIVITYIPYGNNVSVAHGHRLKTLSPPRSHSRATDLESSTSSLWVNMSDDQKSSAPPSMEPELELGLFDDGSPRDLLLRDLVLRNQEELVNAKGLTPMERFLVIDGSGSRTSSGSCHFGLI